MNQREKLVELFLQFAPWGDEYAKNLADYLFDNGVVVLPCRCKECKYSYRIDDTYRVCKKYHYQKLHDESPKNDVADYWFCADGERKGGDE